MLYSVCCVLQEICTMSYCTVCTVLHMRSIHTVQYILCFTRNLYILYSTEYIIMRYNMISVHILQVGTIEVMYRYELL